MTMLLFLVDMSIFIDEICISRACQKIFTIFFNIVSLRNVTGSKKMSVLNKCVK